MSYEHFFESVTGRRPHGYQVRVATQLFDGKNMIVRAPTGAGKTWAVLVPFLSGSWKHPPSRLIYALPLRSLVLGVYHQAREAAGRLGWPIDGQQDERGRETVPPFVTIQTGDQPDDPFFERGKIVVTTYDQVLSGLLDGPYGLSARLHNLNAAAIAGSLVVFDEFHLMEARRAFLTGVACLYLFRDLCQSAWMTATATHSLQDLLCEALGSVPVPETEKEMEVLLNALPSVTTVQRGLKVEGEQLSAEPVLRRHQRRSVVLLNTVRRAQTMYAEIQGMVQRKGINHPVTLLHSRFFKEDRTRKEREIRSRFGRGALGQGILIATQVIEAGIDISCEHLHTELCPMNALIQRAGRCARFEGEVGTVHIYPLPSEARAWLPYGDLRGPDANLMGTRQLLDHVGSTLLDPRKAEQWVQEVHGSEDEAALREGWRSRLKTCLGRIQQSALLRDPKRISDLIRGDETESIRVIVSQERTRPRVPGLREAVTVPRWSLAMLFKQFTEPIGWFWNDAEDDPWKPLITVDDLRNPYVVCLRPSAAAYDREVGLRLGVAGWLESPGRVPPKRPGYAPIKAEPWANHALNVWEEARKRMSGEHGDTGLLWKGFANRYRFTPDLVLEAVRVCALLHDLGKLQSDWQRWAEAAQQARDPNYRHEAALAHTDFDPELAEDRERLRTLVVRRPSHAAAGAFYSGAFLFNLLGAFPEDRRAQVAAACAATILAHHGGWLGDRLDCGIGKLWPRWRPEVTGVLGWAPDENVIQQLENWPDKRGALEGLLNVVIGPNELDDWWPFVAYLTRVLRLSDQRATAETGGRD